MSSALAMVLTAAMAVPGNGPEAMSAEMEPPGLDLSGEWEGTYGTDGKQTWNARLIGDTLSLWNRQNKCRMTIRFVDEGGGKLRFGMGGNPPLQLGTYKDEGDRVVISYGYGPKRNQKAILVLRRVKPRK
jgi:hypothetical protein